MSGAVGVTRATSRVVLDGSGYRLGRYRCPPGEPLWRTENWIGPWHLLAFPGTAVSIRQAGFGRALATANEVVFYNAGAGYHRDLVDPRGDACVFVGCGPELAAELGAPFRFGTGPCPPAAYAVLRLVAAGADLDPELADEAVLTALGEVSDAARGARPGTGAGGRPGGQDRREVVEAVRGYLAERLDRPVRLGDAARHVHYSPYHLARMFRAETGMSLYGYQLQLRLREALDQVVRADHRRLADLANRVGFSSHAHLTTWFGRTFGIPPSLLRVDGDRSAAATTLGRLRRTGTVTPA